MLAACSPVLVAPPLPTPRPYGEYFPETGHTVFSPFLDYFDVTGGLAAHGYPLTDWFVDPDSGLSIQYFEKSRFELHPGIMAPYPVLLGRLGEELGKGTPPVATGHGGAITEGCLYFSETGHNLCSGFLEYWLANGDLDRFGYPIGEFAIEDDLLVQWFQRTRLEWRPERPEGQRVAVTRLGLEFLHGLPVCLYDAFNIVDCPILIPD